MHIVLAGRGGQFSRIRGYFGRLTSSNSAASAGSCERRLLLEKAVGVFLDGRGSIATIIFLGAL